ncbi:hypothetical protein [Serratia sp. BIGb0163]|uniref:hypothetical protein n=1 Tax=Serratia sp. BIGb0163 TaxID=2940613 RepID=UPI002169FF4E|nr:hypothetical protein [Serratia sp. BIGb0163]
MSRCHRGRCLVISANYTAHLYCDCEKCAASFITSAKDEFTGESWSQCAKEARAEGWRISANRERCYAPGHKIQRGGA